MGMFTRIQTNENKIIQIKVGNDFCDTYKIGDSVPFYVDSNIMHSASFADDAYDGLCESENDKDTYWVIIKDSKIEAVLNQNDIEYTCDIYEAPYPQIHQHLISKYNLKQDLYSEECLQKHKREQQEAERVRNELIKQYKDQGLTDGEIFIKFLIAPISVSVDYQKVINSVLTKD